MSRTQLKTISDHIIYPWDIENIDDGTKELFSSTYKSIGNNLVLKGMTLGVNRQNKQINVNFYKGSAIQDLSLIEVNEDEKISFDTTNFSADGGKIVCFIGYSANSEDPKFGVTYIDHSNNDEWETNRIVLGVYDFGKDADNKVTYVQKSNNNFINIKSKRYTIGGLHPDNVYMSNILSTIDYVSKYLTSDYEATCNETLFADTSEGSFTIYLPKNPPVGTKVTIIDCAGMFWDKSLKVDANGSIINDGVSYMYFRFKHSITDLFYSGSKNGWIFNVTRMWRIKGGEF